MPCFNKKETRIGTLILVTRLPPLEISTKSKSSGLRAFVGSKTGTGVAVVGTYEVE